MIGFRVGSNLIRQVRRPGLRLSYSHSRTLCNAITKNGDDEVRPPNLAPEVDRSKQMIAIAFTCTHARENCTTPEGERRTRKVFSRLAYEDGVVLVKCPCEKLHLIADNLGWFGEDTNVEQILKERGEDVQKLSLSDEINIV